MISSRKYTQRKKKTGSGRGRRERSVSDMIDKVGGDPVF